MQKIKGEISIDNTTCTFSCTEQYGAYQWNEPVMQWQNCNMWSTGIHYMMNWKPYKNLDGH